MVVHILHVADAPQIAQRVPHLLHIDRAVVDAAHAGGAYPGIDERPHDALVHQPAQHHLYDIHAGVVGDAQTLDAHLGQPQPRLQVGDGLAAAMHDDWVMALMPHGLHGLHQPVEKVGVVQLIAAHFQDDDILCGVFQLIHDGSVTASPRSRPDRRQG